MPPKWFMNSPKHWPENWSHQVTLLTISNADERLFYEIEARENSWGARELERQIAASLYERLALSRDKAGIRQLTQKGLVIEKSALMLPFILLQELLMNSVAKGIN